MGSLGCPSPTPTSGLSSSQQSEMSHMPGAAEMHRPLPGEGTSLLQAPATLRLSAPVPASRSRSWHCGSRAGFCGTAVRAGLQPPAAHGTLLGNAPDQATAPISPAPFLLLSHNIGEQFHFFKCPCRRKSGFPLSLQSICLKEVGKNWHTNISQYLDTTQGTFPTCYCFCFDIA